ncbi:hypothetical protein E2P81_ATG08503 [Venturia nashicola]|nr:hypothetical protein E2P81_ATG08503 [Venturia nashicola]
MKIQSILLFVGAALAVVPLSKEAAVVILHALMFSVVLDLLAKMSKFQDSLPRTKTNVCESVGEKELLNVRGRSDAMSTTSRVQCLSAAKTRPVPDARNSHDDWATMATSPAIKCHPVTPNPITRTSEQARQEIRWLTIADYSGQRPHPETSLMGVSPEVCKSALGQSDREASPASIPREHLFLQLKALATPANPCRACLTMVAPHYYPPSFHHGNTNPKHTTIILY